MTISAASSLIKDFPMPEMMHGMRKVYEEVFINPCGYSTEDEAFCVLRKIRANHDSAYGWFCLGGIHEGICKDDDGCYRAYRHQAQYRL